VVQIKNIYIIQWITSVWFLNFYVIQIKKYILLFIKITNIWLIHYIQNLQTIKIKKNVTVI